jgi:hypothetical protein
MTRDDIERLAPGDSVIGIAQDDELPIVAVDVSFVSRGRLSRPIHVRQGRATVAALVREGDATIRGAHI